MESYITLFEGWTDIIKDTILREKEKKIEVKSALAEIELWRGRSATFSTLNQQLNHPWI